MKTKEQLKPFETPIRREYYPINLLPQDYQWEKYTRLKEVLEKTLIIDGKNIPYASFLAMKMHSSITDYNPNSFLFGDHYPHSALFTLIKTPQPTGVIIESTKRIQLDGLHTKVSSVGHKPIRDITNIRPRIERGWEMRSGEYGQIRIPETGSKTWVALIDSLMGNNILKPSQSPEYYIALTLLSHDIIPITADGYVASLEKT